MWIKKEKGAWLLYGHVVFREVEKSRLIIRVKKKEKEYGYIIKRKLLLSHGYFRMESKRRMGTYNASRRTGIDYNKYANL